VRSPLVLIVGAAVVGGIAGSAATLVVSPPASDDAGTPAALVERVVELERRAETADRRPERTRRRPAPDDASPALPTDIEPAPTTDDAPGGAERPRELFGNLGLTPPSDEFVARVAAAMELIEQRKKERMSLEKADKSKAKVLADLAKKLTNYTKPLDLTDAEIAEYTELATEYLDERFDAQLEGAEQSELRAMDRAARRGVQALLGADRYRKMRALEIDTLARPVIADTANRAGVTTEQREQIETLLSTHIERMVDVDVRMRTEELPAETLRELQTEVQRMNRQAWDDLRYDILTEEQRGRVPERR
jgi:hypothetical protein